MSEYSPLPGTGRSEEERAEFEDPGTRNSTGLGGSPARGALARLRHRLRATSPFLAQYSALQIGPSPAGSSPAPVVCACATAARPPTSPAPAPRPAPLRTVRRASAGSGGSELRVMTFSHCA